MFKVVSTKEEETILKRAFNNWGVFEVYEKLEIILRSINKKSSSSSSPENEYRKSMQCLKNDNFLSIEKIPLNDNREKTRDFEVYICSNKQQCALTIKLQPMNSGLIIGKVRNKKFLPNVNFAELILRNNPKLNYPYVILENKGANLVLYGRDIMGNSIIDFFREIKENQILIILNQTKEVIGIGRSKYNNNLITQKDKITIDNIQDIGTHYLKKENNYMLV
jgi:60S ribosome subunit biogenesis protein NIP7